MEPSANNKEVKAVKHDKGKLRYDLIPPEALEALVQVYTYGATKYAPDNWRNGMEWSRVFAAIQRHLWAFWNGYDNDLESKLPHLAHAAWGCFTLLSFLSTCSGDDDRVEVHEVLHPDPWED